MRLTENAKVVLERRVATKDENGNPLETPDQIFLRVARNIAEAERNFTPTKEDGDFAVDLMTEKFYSMMSNLDFIPNSPTLVNAGKELQQLSACFVLPVEDSMEGIFESVKQAALIHKTGGGTGFSFSRLRPAYSNVSKTSGVASGPVSFMSVFDKATEVIKQGGIRRGANMGILSVEHPDILGFIHSKDGMDALHNFNISVAITDDFMVSLRSNGDYNLRDPRSGDVVGTLNARSVWSEITSSAHATGDPGVIFIDRINGGKSNPVPSRGPIESTNPCGEQPLYPWDSCNLGSINLSNFVTSTEPIRVDYARLADVVHDAVHFLDNVIEMNNWPNMEIAETSTAIRRIGLGVMGWADMLIKLKVRYDSEEAVDLADKVMECVSTAADKASITLGMLRGSFPDIDKSIYKDWPALRNSTRTTIAPTGTISIIAGCSSGIEPNFAFKYTRSHYLDKNDPDKRTELVEFHSELAKWMDMHDVPTPLPDYFVSAHEINPEWHVRMQAAFQKHTDNAVSKTINLPKEATIEDVEKAYSLAWQLGCMGVTIYRDGSRDMQVLKTNSEDRKDNESEGNVLHGINGNVMGEEANSYVGSNRNNGNARKKLPRGRRSYTQRVDLGGTETFITVGEYDDGSPGELFIVANRAGSSVRGYLDSFATMFSYALQYGVPLDKICDKLTATRFEPSGFTGDPEIPVATSIVDYIARFIRRRYVDRVEKEEYDKVPSGNICPECGGALFYGEGCETCVGCGYAKCG